ncbi:MAG: outer membrane protein assembly factor BamB [Hydrogenophaga sp.]|nr:outer membrane protein assembly factor BamB [Hydrogenophaga sp.]
MTSVVLPQGAGRAWRLLAGTCLLAVLAACGSSGSKKPEPAPLAPVNALLGVRQAWSLSVGASAAPLSPAVLGNQLWVGSTDGSVVALDAAAGRELWRGQAGAPLTAGVGSDGNTVAVVTVANELVAMEAGRVTWRARLGVGVFTPPLVAGRRVFVLGADRSLRAFDAANGARLWQQNRPGDALSLRQAGLLMAVGDTLVAGQQGRLAGFDPNSGALRWDSVIASPRGTNEIERLVELVAGASRQGNQLCVRAFQAAVGCVDATRGTTVWSRAAAGAVGVAGDDSLLFGTEATGRVLAWQRASGEPAWSSDRFLHRGLTAPVVVGRSVVFGDAGGFLHMLSRQDGSVLNRLSTDGAGLAAAPVLVGDTLVAVTRKGGVFGWRPE